jgi:hypothetical protein
MSNEINVWQDRLADTAKFGFSVTDTRTHFGYAFPSRSINKIMLKCRKCDAIVPWLVGDFYRKLVAINKVYQCSSCRQYTLEDVQQKIDDIFGQGLITIAPNQTYTGIRDPLKFIDRDYGEWTSAAFNIITNKNTHPKRSIERRKQTNLAKYGHENAFGSDQIKEKIKRINLEKYGVENPMQNKEVKEKLQNTFIEKYGCPVPLVGNAEVLKKVKKTNLERYGREKYANVTHGKSDTPEYRCWIAIRIRCYDKNDISYPNYGGRGITVCDEWLVSFDSFYTDMGRIPTDGKKYSIERIDNSKNYVPTNCRWATYTEQANNRRDNVNLNYMGRTQTLAQWADELGLNRGTLWSRLNKHNWSVERALSTPARH